MTRFSLRRRKCLNESLHIASTKMENNMFRTVLLPALFAGLLTLLTSSQADAYGAVHRGYTTVSPSGGVQHHGQTAAYGPQGGYSASHTGSTTASGGTVDHTGSTTASGP